MPRYDYSCITCETITEVVQSFAEDSLTNCDVCNGPINRVYTSINFSSAATPTRGKGANTMDEKKLEKDLSAYKRLRREGLQPKSTKGAAELEARASTKYEVETGVVVDKYLAKRVDEAKTKLVKDGVI